MGRDEWVAVGTMTQWTRQSDAERDAPYIRSGEGNRA
jgi:hypothetical protein